jgi:hypothetical protein
MLRRRTREPDRRSDSALTNGFGMQFAGSPPEWRGFPANGFIQREPGLLLCLCLFFRCRFSLGDCLCRFGLCRCFHRLCRFGLCRCFYRLCRRLLRNNLFLCLVRRRFSRSHGFPAADDICRGAPARLVDRHYQTACIATQIFALLCLCHRHILLFYFKVDPA